MTGMGLHLCTTGWVAASVKVMGRRSYRQFEHNKMWYDAKTCGIDGNTCGLVLLILPVQSNACYGGRPLLGLDESIHPRIAQAGLRQVEELQRLVLGER